MNLPKRYQDQILAELEKPKSQQKITEDLFIELERSLTTVERALPDIMPDRDKVRRILLKKFKNGIINNRVLFRQMARIARAERVGGDLALARKELRKLFEDNSYTIESAYRNSVGNLYAERDLGTRVSTLLELLDDIDIDDIDNEVRGELQQLSSAIDALLRGDA